MSKLGDKLRLEILKGNHLEHFKIAKDMAQVVDIDDYRRKRIEDEANNLIEQIHITQSKLKSK